MGRLEYLLKTFFKFLIMEPVDYDDTSSEDDDDQSSHSSSSTHSKSHGTDNQTVKDTNTDNLNLAASLQQILQSHQQKMDNETKPKHNNKLKQTILSPNSNALIANPNKQPKSEKIAFFILRSNNEENVRTSMEKCVWATQPQNEAILNDAFEVFSHSKKLKLTCNHILCVRATTTTIKMTL